MLALLCVCYRLRKCTLSLKIKISGIGGKTLSFGPEWPIARLAVKNSPLIPRVRGSGAWRKNAAAARSTLATGEREIWAGRKERARTRGKSGVRVRNFPQSIRDRTERGGAIGTPPGRPSSSFRSALDLFVEAACTSAASSGSSFPSPPRRPDRRTALLAASHRSPRLGYFLPPQRLVSASVLLLKLARSYHAATG